MLRYLEEEVPKHTASTQLYETGTIRGWIEDSQHLLAKRIEERDRAILAQEPCETIRARRVPRDCLEWLQKPFAAIETTDIESYIVDRVTDGVENSTIDREIDVWAAVVNWAIDVLKIHVGSNPMKGVRRPKYFNERDRRLSEEEKERLFEAARAEDRAQSPDLYMQHRLESVRVEARKLPNLTARKRFIAAARQRIAGETGGVYPHLPLFEALLAFLLTSAARRGEALKLPWDQLDLDAQTALFKETKNGTNRTVPLGIEVIPILARLPRYSDRVFPITLDNLKKTWARMCERAGVEDFHLHDLRHTAISEVIEDAFLAGCPLNIIQIQAYSGHRDLASLARYTHLSAGLMAKCLDENRRLAAKQRKVHKGRPIRWVPSGRVAFNSVLASMNSPAPDRAHADTSDVDAMQPYNCLPV
jgi:integrase